MLSSLFLSFRCLCVASEAVFSFRFVQILLILLKMPVSSIVFGACLFVLSFSVSNLVVLVSSWIAFISIRDWIGSFGTDWVGFTWIDFEFDTISWFKFDSFVLEWEHTTSYSFDGDFLLAFLASGDLTTKRDFRTKCGFPAAIILSSHFLSSGLKEREKHWNQWKGFYDEKHNSSYCQLNHTYS